MFVLHSSNKAENLLDHLATIIRTAPLASPLAKEVFLIQSQGMERWLSQQLASKLRVWGNYEFLFPGRFFSSLTQQIDLSLNDTVFDRQQMLWRLESLLRGIDDDDVYKPLRHYLFGGNKAVKRYQLAQQLAQLFDQYQIMRPTMLDAWQQGRLYGQNSAEPWQQKLWQKIIAETGPAHRGQLWQAAIAKLNTAAEGELDGQLPERISVFGVNTMPPLFLDYLQGLSKHCQLHYFLLNPAQVYWADLTTRRQQITEKQCDGHPLLSALGQQGREFQAMLLEQVQFEWELESFEPNTAPSNLQQLQNDILDNSVEGRPLDNDGSISIHACHSRLREVEVLKNQLLQALQQDQTMELRDIVVMAPDIQAYEPFIASVFDGIQHAVADRSLRLGNKVLDTFIQFLHLAQSRFGWQSVLDLLEQPAVYQGFNLSETDLDLLKQWLRDTRVGWGKSAEHKRELGLPEIGDCTWQAVLDRFLMGYAIGDGEGFIGAILPYTAIEGSSAQALGGLHDYLQLLFAASTELQQAQTRPAWSNKLFFYADQLLAGANHAERQQLNELLQALSSDMQTTGGSHDNETIELQVIISWLEGMMEEHKSANGFLRGQLTFCSMLPMRSIPFKVIALLGINEGEFPKIDRNPTFDLLTHHFQKGDRSRRNDDRYQFLEILLSARQQLIITYIGQSIRSNELIPPSIVASELVDVLESHYQLDGLLIRHPLHGFSARNFDGGKDVYSFSQTDLAIAKALAASKPITEPWWQGDLPQETDNIIEIQDLFAFYRHPQKHFCERQLGLRFTGIEVLAEEREPFAINGLDNYLIQQQWIKAVLDDRAFSVAKLQAQGLWLQGAPGELAFAQQGPAIAAFAERVRAKNSGQASPDLHVDICVGPYRLVGKLGHLYQNHCLFYRFADLKGADFIAAWLQHLMLNSVSPQETWLISSDKECLFLPGQGDAGQLMQWLDIYQQGRQRPDAFFVEPAFAYIKAKKSGLEAAAKQLEHAVQQPYELALRRLYWLEGQQSTINLAAILTGQFEKQCQDLLLPIWQQCQENG